MQLPVAVDDRIQQTRFLSGSRSSAFKYLNIPENSSMYSGRIKFPMCSDGSSIKFLSRKNPRSPSYSCSPSHDDTILKLRSSKAVSINQYSSYRRACRSVTDRNRIIGASRAATMIDINSYRYFQIFLRHGRIQFPSRWLH